MKLFKLHSSIKMVKGFNRSALYDLERKKIYFIPNSLYFILNNYSDIIKIKKKFVDEIVVIDEYFSFLIKNELINFVNNETINLFKDINKMYDNSSNIIHASLIIYSKKIDVKNIITELNANTTLEVEIRFLYDAEYKDIIKILQEFNNTKIKAIKIYLKYNKNIVEKINITIKNINYRLTRITFYSSPINNIKKIGKVNELLVVYNKNTIINETKTIPSVVPFVINKDLFLESVNYNSFYNKKIYIDSDGNISPTIYFNPKFKLDNNGIKNIITKPVFTNLWKLKKDKIITCKDCELRYLCIDARLPNNNNGEYSFDSECGYNPYISLWKGQDNWISTKEWRENNEK